jgi:predicted nucleic acid-binding protein
LVLPRAVHREIVEDGVGLPGAAEIRSSSWIEVRDVADLARVAELLKHLDEGEAEAIALAVELKPDLLLMDERRGRVEAARRGIRLVGILGALTEAKRRAILPEIRPALDDLRDKAGFRLSPALYARVLLDNGE